MKMWICSGYSFMLSILLVLITSNSVTGWYCYDCTSSNYTLCSTLHSLKELPEKLCDEGVVACFMKVEGRYTVRGCLYKHNEKDCEDTKTCVRCRGDKCNAEIFPEDRLFYLHCDGEKCVNQSNTVDVRMPCLNYSPNDECYTIFTPTADKAYRGCMTDIGSKGHNYCMEHSESCLKCSTRGCNSQGPELQKELVCANCNPHTEGNGRNCNLIDKKYTTVKCDRPPLGYKNVCYTYENGDDDPIRGCFNNAPYTVFKECFVKNETCHTCDESDCNNLTPKNQM